MVCVLMKKIAILVGIIGAHTSANAQGFAGLGASSPDFQQVVPGQALNFPQDHLAHDDYRIEWWYVTANLTDEDGHQLGLQWTLFRQALSVQPLVEGWANQTVWMGHAAVTTSKTHKSAERFARGGIGQAGVVGARFSAWIDDWQMSNPAAADLSSLNLTATGEDFSYAVTLSANMPQILQGDNGFSVKSEQGQASYYYSQPFYTVSGTVTINGKKTEVTGNAWLDREWSSQPLGETQTGWDWFSLHLDDTTKLMLFRLRDADGGAFYSGNLIGADGSTRQLARDAITITARQMTKINGRHVPTSWKISIPSIGVDLTTKALNRKAMMDTIFSYWEGPISFAGSHRGVGYLEMTGY